VSTPVETNCKPAFSAACVRSWSRGWGGGGTFIAAMPSALSYRDRIIRRIDGIIHSPKEAEHVWRTEQGLRIPINAGLNDV
jgi:hypothetical protein